MIEFRSAVHRRRRIQRRRLHQPGIRRGAGRRRSRPTLTESHELVNDAQRILFHDMPVVPLWDYISVVGWSSQVSNVTVTWNGLPDYENIVKA